MGAIGAVMYSHSNKLDINPFKGLEELQAYLKKHASKFVSLPQLIESEAVYNKEVKFHKERNQKNCRFILGIDVGSLSTNVVLIDKEHNVVAQALPPDSRASRWKPYREG